ncbi:LPS assembly lipoprotein LptE [Mesorhizobium sp. BR1-1-16]|uniref:LPS assembly lipoprotein LptE n=1 Tax=Mesorhizobium sp. BR1-1-16 TaxID=2876653 RepID=UPI001CCE30BC|nr:LPS assembly lipoprotein LptE [Mesorhizobium sp. BR1-1-16]MBZ9938010.1 LPS assembly lipoprotein LptE [Mesorhizobium sp. BR1-1-16]
MSSSDRKGASRRAFGFAGVALIGALAAGCVVRPVYMPTAAGGAPAADLSAIAVDQVGDRVSQEVRNNLIFAFTGGKPAPAPRFNLSISVSNSEARLGFEKDETAPAYQVTVAVRFELKDLASGRSIIRSTASGVASYDRSNQNFANERARIDAENRAAQAVADQMQLRLAIALAKEAKITVATPQAAPKVDAPSIIGSGN